MKRKAAARRPAKKPARKAPTRAFAAEDPTGLDLKALRERVARAVSALSKRVGATSAAEAKLDDTRRRMSQWMTDIDEICTPEEKEVCGETMVIPIP